MKPQTQSPHCRPPAEDDLDDRVCSCSPEPYWLDWLEEQEQKEKEQTQNPSANPPPKVPPQELQSPPINPSNAPPE